MKNALKGIALIFFGVLLVIFQISCETEYEYLYADLLGLIVGGFGLMLVFKDDILKGLNKLNEKEDKKDDEKETGENET